MRLDGKVVLITGASRGQGALEARAVVEAGGIAVVADVLDDQGAALVEELRVQEPRCSYRHLDVTDADQWTEVCEWVDAAHGRLDALVNNAGIGHRVPLMETERGVWDTILAVNLTGAMLGTQAVVPLMTTTGGGSIVNISSVAGLTAWPAVAYSVSKWGLRGLTMGSALELGTAGIRVNSVHPGLIASAFTQDAPAEFHEAYARTNPMGRVGDPADIAPLVVFLCSDSATFISGTEMTVDGGFVGAGAGQGMLTTMAALGGDSMLHGRSTAQRWSSNQMDGSTL